MHNKMFSKKKEKKKATLPEKVKENKGRKEKKLRSDKRKQEKIHLHPIFSPFWRELFGELRKKTSRPHYLFSFLSTQPNILQKKFPSYFLSKVFHPPYFTSKQTHPKKCKLT